MLERKNKKFMNSNLSFPPLWKRFGVTIIDLHFVFLIAYVITAILPSSLPDGTNVFIAALALLYDPICTAFACTFGAFLFKIRVRRFDDSDKKLNFFKAILRYITKLLLGWISFLTIHSNEHKRAIHDFVSDSVVINL